MVASLEMAPPKKHNIFAFDADEAPPSKLLDVMNEIDDLAAAKEEDDEHTSSFGSSDRDEVQEVRNVAKRDTNRVVMWRFIATSVLLLTALAVTAITYSFLQKQQTESFETQFKQFSRTVADAALEQQERARLAQWSMARMITAYVETNDPGAWPLYHMPLFPAYAKDGIAQAKVETAGLFIKVDHDKREAWEKFVNETYQDVVDEAHMLRQGNLDRLDQNPNGFKPFIYQRTPEGIVPDIEREYYWPSLDYAPAPQTYSFINWNIASNDVYGPLLGNMMEMRTEAVISRVKPYSAAAGLVFSQEEHQEMHSHVNLLDTSIDSPHAFWFFPVYEKVGDPESPIVASYSCPMAWDVFMIGLLPEGVDGITIVLENSCGQEFTFEIDGPRVTYVGEGDYHDTQYNYLETYQDLMEGFHSHPRYNELNGHCRYAVRIYPSEEFESSLDPYIPMVFAIVVASTFVLVVVVFFIYDMFVQRRNEKLVSNAAQSNAIVSSLFPSNIRDRLINTGGATAESRSANNLKHFMRGDAKSAVDADIKKPLADLFLECTVLFADIAGFTAWSSVREPSQVFTILETVYGEFDHIAKVRKVFKVETVGDCYVAATGIPEYKKDHAVVMIRFARDIIAKMSVLTKQLEVTLGPDTADLSLRIGIHSGPVTAGVLRGERARFQLFGDTMNVCSRVESSGTAGRIHVSAVTAEILKKSGKPHWLIKREEKVEAKGLGEIQTFWIGVGVENDRREESIAGSTVGNHRELNDLHAVYEPVDRESKDARQDARVARLVDWNVEMLSQIMRHIIARRNGKHNRQEQPRGAAGVVAQRGRNTASNSDGGRTTKNYKHQIDDKKQYPFIPIDEVVEIIQLPEFDAKAANCQEDPNHIVLDEEVVSQLRSYCSTIATMYRNNAFHNFEHASHVTMSVIKLLSRIVAPTELLEDDRIDEDGIGGQSLHALHDHTYGITSDPLTQFACAFAAMIHDTDHVGVPNSQLVKENARIVHLYGSRSVAEQNSVVLAWDLLMMDEYNTLRSTLCSDQAELERFRQLVVNGVMATDIVDKDLKQLRNSRWEKAFKIDDIAEMPESERAAVNRKATIVIEHLIQASDVAHTMQHWHVYRKWNEKFFRECYNAYTCGRAEKDPSEGWYKGEIGFFDFYIIPLAKKLKECGVFGKSSDEYLTYARANRLEWERRGQQVVAEMLESIKREEQQAATAPSSSSSAGKLAVEPA